MPTIQQLVRRGRKPIIKKSKAVALARGFNLVKNTPVYYPSPFKRGVCLKVFTTSKIFRESGTTSSAEFWTRPELREGNNRDLSMEQNALKNLNKNEKAIQEKI
ncbi:MAG: 30S ribosomal protein S12 [Candidatus Giovannonibacteria bacterium GW2011_GWB1_45_9b]|uniref:30S ribosomal protein S12 n=1 Tax=Candidatus Giovannonibacteria bacterium GW2011_GWB1_45_9b TaxID=1618653 RepID=A0A0G1N855_9BACT|nr:MAG: 30S ribosomal protein S12 [Candidatus Giovannonibacteria bacterium GW2011_GWB1_45_9b]